MRILQLTPQFPWPTHQGTTLRNFNILKGLARGHELHLFSMLGPGDDPAAGPVSGLVASLAASPQPRRTMGARLRDLLLSPQPDMARRLWSPAAFQGLARFAREIDPDILLIEGIEMAPYFFAMREAGVPTGRAIYDAHNAETLLQQRAARADLRRPARWPAALYSAIQMLKLRRYEARLVRSVAGVAAVSERDAHFLRTLGPETRLEVVTNGVDIALYRPDESFPPVFHRPGPHLLFTGKMDFRPNVDAALWFANEVLPRLRGMGAPAHFWVVGRSPHARLKALRGRDDVTVTGEVPDVRPYIVQADVYVAPLLAGGGTRFKILEALVLAKPVVSTTLGADGIPVVDGEHLALADAPDVFARRVAELLAHEAKARAMGRRGRAFVAAQFDWSVIIPRMESLFQALA
ncbi:MAG TPA: glycosyltransferase [Caldilineae bacterium]|nr:glycosyltransferase [Caldilineae bacterium]